MDRHRKAARLRRKDTPQAMVVPDNLKGYVVTQLPDGTVVPFHSFIVPWPWQNTVFINGDLTDNRRSNLREKRPDEM